MIFDLRPFSFVMKILRGRCRLDHWAEMDRTIISVTGEFWTGISFYRIETDHLLGNFSSTSVNNTLERRGALTGLVIIFYSINPHSSESVSALVVVCGSTQGKRANWHINSASLPKAHTYSSHKRQYMS